MSEMPEDIWEKANEIYRLIANPTKLEKMAQLLTPVERIAYALWAERKNTLLVGREMGKRDLKIDLPWTLKGSPLTPSTLRHNGER